MQDMCQQGGEVEEELGLPANRAEKPASTADVNALLVAKDRRIFSLLGLYST